MKGIHVIVQMNGHAPFQRDAIMVLTNLLEKVQLRSVCFLYCLEKVIMWAMWRTYLMLLYKIFDMFGGIFKIRIFWKKKLCCAHTKIHRTHDKIYRTTKYSHAHNITSRAHDRSRIFIQIHSLLHIPVTTWTSILMWQLNNTDLLSVSKRRLFQRLSTYNK